MRLVPGCEWRKVAENWDIDIDGVSLVWAVCFGVSDDLLGQGK